MTEVGSDTASSEKEEDERKSKPVSRCAWPNKPRLPEDKFKEFRAECRRVCPETCFQFLVGTCRDPACSRPHDVPAAFEAVRKKFR